MPLGLSQALPLPPVLTGSRPSPLFLGPESSPLNEVVSEAFVRFFVEIVGHYSLFLTAGEREERTLQREAFRKAVSSKSLRRFLEVFMETQTFRGFIQERELRRQDAKGEGAPSNQLETPRPQRQGAGRKVMGPGRRWEQRRPEPHSRFWWQVLLVFHLANSMKLSRACSPVPRGPLLSFSSGLSSLLPFFPASLCGVWHQRAGAERMVVTPLGVSASSLCFQLTGRSTRGSTADSSAWGAGGSSLHEPARLHSLSSLFLSPLAGLHPSSRAEKGEYVREDQITPLCFLHHLKSFWESES